mmetsp:Transcript_36308/g.86867  ORF Transcript_36308/g.86867 Transcript_36308/m.86867 type:complete len:219 (-) Transcript_36308:5-661(-)
MCFSKLSRTLATCASRPSDGTGRVRDIGVAFCSGAGRRTSCDIACPLFGDSFRAERMGDLVVAKGDGALRSNMATCSALAGLMDRLEEPFQTPPPGASRKAQGWTSAGPGPWKGTIGCAKALCRGGDRTVSGTPGWHWAEDGVCRQVMSGEIRPTGEGDRDSGCGESKTLRKLPAWGDPGAGLPRFVSGLHARAGVGRIVTFATVPTGAGVRIRMSWQ